MKFMVHLFMGILGVFHVIVISEKCISSLKGSSFKT